MRARYRSRQLIQASASPALAWPLVGVGAGAKVISRDSKGYWYRAQTLDERREPSSSACGFPGLYAGPRITPLHGHAERVEPSRINNKLTKALIVQLKP